MPDPKSRWNDEFLDQVVSTLLRTGVILASIVVLIGGVMYVVQYWHVRPDYRVFQSEPLALRSIREIAAGVFTFHSRRWMQFGLLLLVLTPTARVAFSVFAFIKERDYLYVVFTLIVFGILLLSLSGH